MEERRKWWKSGMASVVGIALGTVVVHLATGWRYGFDRDELMALEDARHLAWGYVQYPPMTAFFGWIALKLFGTSLGGFRFFAALVQAVALVLTGLMAREIARSEAGKRVASEQWRVTSDGRDGEPSGAKAREEGGRNVAAEAATHKAGRAWARADGPPQMAGPTEAWEAGEWAMVVAALAGVPFCLGAGALMQYISFDYVCWVLVAWGMVKLVASDGWRVASEEKKIQDPPSKFEGGAAASKDNWKSTGKSACGTDARWWVVVGAGIGLGMLAKYTMGLLVIGIVVGVLATDARKYLKSGWLWAGVAVSVAIFLPNFLWEWKRNFVSLDFLRFVHERDMHEGVTNGFFVGQLEMMMMALPLAAAGLWFCFFGGGKRYRVLGWMYVVPLALLVVLRGRDYYLAPAYPMLYAAGAVWMERQWRVRSGGQWLATSDQGRIRKVVWAALVVDAVVAGAVALPIAPVNSPWWKMASKRVVVFPEEIGWPEFTRSVAEIWRRLPEEERAQAGILAGNYGEVGALNLYGEQYGLPRAMSGVNSSWERGYGSGPETVVVVGYSREFLEKYFETVEVRGRVWNKYGVANEETVEDPLIFVCRGMRGSWEEFWKAARRFA